MRDYKILKNLYECDGYVSLNCLSKSMNVSGRTIQNDIKALNNISKKYGYKIGNLRGKGYFLDVENEKLFLPYIQSMEKFKTKNKEERLVLIASMLLLKNDYISQESIAETLNVSKSIVKSDMDFLREYFEERKICLERKAHYGVKIVADDCVRKQAILHLYEQESQYVREEIDALVGDAFKEVEKQLICLLNENELSTNYIELKKIDLFIKICIYTNLKGLNQFSAEHQENSFYEKIAHNLKETIEKYYDIQLSEGDVKDIACCIRSKTKQKRNNIHYSEGLEEMLHSFLMKCDEKYNSNYLEDAEFQLSLLSHVSLLLDRLHQSISFSNPMIDEISVKYPVNLNIAIQFAQELECAYDVSISQDEIGFIATHFAAHMERNVRNMLSKFNKIAVVCSTGGGSAFLIKLKLENLFSGKDIRTFSFFQEDVLLEYHPDVIFTVTDLYHKFDVPIIKINELLDDNDILKIRNMFNLGKENVIENIGMLATLMKKECFFVFEEDMKYEDVLKVMSKNVERLGLASSGYESSVLLRESYVSTIYKNGISIPHPLTNFAKENLISVGIVKSKNSLAKIVFMANLLKDNNPLLQEITRILFDVMENENHVNFLMEANSFEDFTMRLYTLNK